MANRFWVGGNAAWDATAGTKWSLTTGGAGGQAVPTSSDDVFLDHGTGHGSVTVATSQPCKSLTCTGYTDTLTLNSGAILTVSGAITFVAGMAVASDGAGILNPIVTATLTSGGLTFPWQTSFGGTSQTYTLADDWHHSATVTFAGATTKVLSGNTLTVSGAVMNTTLGGGTLSGTTTLILTGSAAWTNSGGATVQNNVNITGNASISGTIKYNTGTITYTSGTISGTGTLSFTGPATISGGTWPNIDIASGLTLTINSAITVTGTLTLPDSNVTFAGTAGYTVGTWTNPTTVGVGATYTHTAGNVYTVTKFFNPITAGNAVSLVSSDGTNTFRFTLPPPASQNVPGITATRVDSTAGEAVYDPGGTLTTALNWYTTYPWGQFFCGG